MPLFPDRLETARLELEALTTEPLDPLTLYEYSSHREDGIEDVTQYLTWGPHETPQTSRDFIERVSDDRAAGERAAELMRVAFDRLDLDVVAVECDVANEQSRRAIQKYVDAHGGEKEGTLRNWTDHGDGPTTAHRYSVTQAEYRAAVEN